MRFCLSFATVAAIKAKFLLVKLAIFYLELKTFFGRARPPRRYAA